MIVHVSNTLLGILLQVRAESGKRLGDFATLIRPGEIKLGRPYKFWEALGDGEHTVGEDK